jgi:hypothetical protein
VFLIRKMDTAWLEHQASLSPKQDDKPKRQS